MPAPKQANAPAIIRIALRGDRAWPLAGRGMNLLLFVRVNPRWEASVTSEPADGLRKSSCRSVRSRGSNRFEGSSSWLGSCAEDIFDSRCATPRYLGSSVPRSDLCARHRRTNTPPRWFLSGDHSAADGYAMWWVIPSDHPTPTVRRISPGHLHVIRRSAETASAIPSCCGTCRSVNVFGPKTHPSPRRRTGLFCLVPSSWVAKMVAGDCWSKIWLHKSGKANRSADACSAKLTARTPKRSGHRHRCVGYLVGVSRAEWWRRAQAGHQGWSKY